MSFLDLDDFLIDLAGRADIVYSPLLDTKHYPERVDVVLVEGAIANQEHLEMIRAVRSKTRTLISFGDCAVTGNVTAVRNSVTTAWDVLERSYVDQTDLNPQVPAMPEIVPPLLDSVLPVHAVVKVDFYLPGCPPPAARIRAVLEQLLAGARPHLEGREIRFG
jgi:NAD-reducing hydrogenase small subunit